MMESEEFKCPSCGASKITHTGRNEYQCDYCGSVFRSEEEAEPEQIYYEPAPEPEKVKPRATLAGKLIAGFFLGLVVIFLIFFFWVISTAKSSDADAGKKPIIESSACLLGSRGAVVWQVSKVETKKSLNYTLRLIDPITKKVTVEKDLAGQHLDTDFYSFNDTVYNTSASGIVAFDLYSGKKLFGFDYFRKKFPLLKTGTAITGSDYENKRVKIVLASGTEMYYYFDTRQLLKEKDYDAQNLKNTFEKEICLSQNKEARLYLCNMKNAAKENYALPLTTIEPFMANPSYKTREIKSIKLLSDTVYPLGKSIAKYTNDLLFLYASGYTNQANGILALVNKKGTITWRNSDLTFKALVQMSASFINYRYYKNILVMYSYPEKTSASIGVDLKTGKTLFVFSNKE